MEQTRLELRSNFSESVVNGNVINEKSINISIISINLDEIKLKSSSDYFSDEITDSSLRNLNEASDYVLNFEQCLEELINVNDNDLNEKDFLYLLRVDVEQDGMKFPNFFYEIYQSLGKNYLDILDIKRCEDIKTIINIYNAYLEEKVDKYNSSSGYYNDICHTAKSKYNTDIILSRRQLNYVEYNMSVCGLNCEFIYYNKEDQKAVCSCNIKTEIPLLKKLRFDKYILLNSFTKINNIMNVKMLKCYKTVFDSKNIINNIGFYIFIIFILLDVIFVILFYSKDYKKLISEIIKMKPDNKSINITSSNKKNIKNNRLKQKQNKNVNKSINITSPNKKNITNKRLKQKGKKNQKSKKINDLKSSQIRLISTYDKPKNKNNKNKEKYLIEYTIKKKKKNLNHSELNSLKYKEALDQDKRSYTQYYISLFQTNHSLFYVFYNKDHNSKIIKITIFIFQLSSDITVNALFFTDTSMDKLYINHGTYNIIYQFPKIIYSSLISTAFNMIIKFLGLSESDILKLKNEKNIKKIDVIKKLKIKFIFFFIMNFLFQIIFCYYVTCFCGVYKNTQIVLFKDSLISFFVSLITPFAIYLLPGLFRIYSLKNKNECCYNISSILQLL